MDLILFLCPVWIRPSAMASITARDEHHRERKPHAHLHLVLAADRVALKAQQKIDAGQVCRVFVWRWRRCGAVLIIPQHGT
ncbi:MAG: hypothetical protein KAI47_08470 [Deltaproteobacteria bacterium]|nr:hypothetical protein [Deltaproteobacteria bacterium]